MSWRSPAPSEQLGSEQMCHHCRHGCRCSSVQATCACLLALPLTWKSQLSEGGAGVQSAVVERLVDAGMVQRDWLDSACLNM